MKIALGIGVAVILLAGGVFAWQQQRTAPKTTQTQPAVTSTKNPTPSTPPMKVEPKITLPAADAFTPIPGDSSDDAHIWKIVTKQKGYSNTSYVPKNIVQATVPTRSDKTIEERSLRADIMPEVERLFKDAKSAGYDLMIGSGYRSYALQKTYFDSYSKTYGEAKANTFSARPGHSEHQSGLAFDIAYTNKTCYLDECFGDTPAGKWVAEHAHNYGFIIRYQRNVPNSDYIYEPWHLRYVGKELALALKQSGMTLDTAEPYLAGKK